MLRGARLGLRVDLRALLQQRLAGLQQPQARREVQRFGAQRLPHAAG